MLPDAQSDPSSERVREPDPAPAPRLRPARRTRSRGQSVTEFALILPLMLGFLGLTIDFARVFQVWMTLESATRDAAEAAATTATTSASALSLARQTVCLQSRTLPGFQPSSSPAPNNINQCVAPNVSVSSFSVSSTAPGATVTYPIGSATVQVSVPFRTLFAYPFITQNGSWTVVTRGSFSVVQGRK